MPKATGKVIGLPAEAKIKPPIDIFDADYRAGIITKAQAHEQRMRVQEKKKRDAAKQKAANLKAEEEKRKAAKKQKDKQDAHKQQEEKAKAKSQMKQQQQETSVQTISMRRQEEAARKRKEEEQIREAQKRHLQQEQETQERLAAHPKWDQVKAWFNDGPRKERLDAEIKQLNYSRKSSWTFDEMADFLLQKGLTELNEVSQTSSTQSFTSCTQQQSPSVSWNSHANFALDGGRTSFCTHQATKT